MKNNKNKAMKLIVIFGALLLSFNCHADKLSDIGDYIEYLSQKLLYERNPGVRRNLESQIRAYKAEYNRLEAAAQAQARTKALIARPQQARVQRQVPTTAATATAAKISAAQTQFTNPTGRQWSTREPAPMRRPAGQRGGGNWSRAYRDSFIKFVNDDKRMAVRWKIYVDGRLTEQWTQGPRSKHWYLIPNNRCVTRIDAGSAVYEKDLCGTGLPLPRSSERGYPGYRAKYRGRGRLNVQQVRH